MQITLCNPVWAKLRSRSKASEGQSGYFHFSAITASRLQLILAIPTFTQVFFYVTMRIHRLCFLARES